MASRFCRAICALAWKMHPPVGLGRHQPAISAVQTHGVTILVYQLDPVDTAGTARSAADFERLHSKVLTKLPGVARVDSSFVLRSVVRQAGLPLD